jgi:hypothetical protein
LKITRKGNCRDFTRLVERLEVFHSQVCTEITLPSSYIILTLCRLKEEKNYKYQ